MIPCVSAVVLLIALVSFAGGEVRKANEKAEVNTIVEIMLKAHQPGRTARRALDQRVIDGRSSDEEKQKLLTLYEALARRKPPKGSEQDWKKRTEAIVEAARAVVKGEEGAAKKLSKALDCKACHERHRE
jgi:hypothetical protein